MDAPTLRLETPAQVAAVLEQRARNIHNAHGLLELIVARHDATIQKRWASKKKPAKAKLLEAVWPGLPAHHRPDLLALRLSRAGTLDTAPRAWRRTACLWPSINAEDLTRPRTLPLLLGARARHAPAAFVRADLAAARFAALAGIDGVSANIDNADVTGLVDRLLPGHGLAMVSARDALTVFAVQERLLKFLVAAAAQVMHDIPLATLLGDAYPVVPEARAPDAAVGPGEPLAAAVLDAPYRAPAAADATQVVSLLEGLEAACETDVVLLREDPVVFAEALRRVHGQVANGATPDAAWGTAVARAVCLYLLVTVSVAAATGHARALVRLQKAHGAHLIASGPVPGDYARALAALRALVAQLYDDCARALPAAFADAAANRALFRVTSNGSLAVDKAALATLDASDAAGAADAASLDSIHWVLDSLTHNTSTADKTVLLDELQRLATASDAAARRFAPLVSAALGHASVLARCSTLLDGLAPTADRVPTDIDAAARAEAAQEADHIAQLAAQITPAAFVGVAPGVARAATDVAYPADAPRSVDSVVAMQAAERQLDDVWAAIDAVLARNTGLLKEESIAKIFDAVRMLRTPAYDAAEDAAAGANGTANCNANGTTNGTIGKKKKKKSQAAVAAAAAAAVATGTNGPASASIDGPAPVLAPLSQVVPIRGTPKADADETATAPIALPARAYKALRTLFARPAAGAPPADLAWADVVFALAAAGLAVQKMYGSAWFVAQVADGGKSLVLNEPADGKVSPDQARALGRRLQLVYGWDRASFVAKK